MKVLIVDDSSTMRMLVKRTLRLAGFTDLQLVEAENGIEALEWLPANRRTWCFAIGTCLR